VRQDLVLLVGLAVVLSTVVHYLLHEQQLDALAHTCHASQQQPHQFKCFLVALHLIFIQLSDQLLFLFVQAAQQFLVDVRVVDVLEVNNVVVACFLLLRVHIV